MNAHLGIIKVHDKVCWIDQYGSFIGRVQFIGRLPGGEYLASVRVLPFTSWTHLRTVPLTCLERMP